MSYLNYADYNHQPKWWAFTEKLYLYSDELYLFKLWLTFADPALHLDAIRLLMESENLLHPNTTSNKRLLNQLINESQEGRFALVAQYLDIRECMRTLRALREEYEWDETLEVLKTMQADDDREYLGNGKEGK